MSILLTGVGNKTAGVPGVAAGYYYKGAQTVAPTNDSPIPANWTQTTSVLADSYGDTATFVSQAVGGLGTSAYLSVLFVGTSATWITEQLSVYYGPGTTVNSYYWDGAAWALWSTSMQVVHLSDSWENISANPTDRLASAFKLVLEVASADGTQSALRCSYWVPS